MQNCSWLVQTNWPTFIEYLPNETNKFRKKSKNNSDKLANEIQQIQEEIQKLFGQIDKLSLSICQINPETKRKKSPKNMDRLANLY